MIIVTTESMPKSEGGTVPAEQLNYTKIHDQVQRKGWDDVQMSRLSQGRGKNNKAEERSKHKVNVDKAALWQGSGLEDCMPVL